MRPVARLLVDRAPSAVAGWAAVRATRFARPAGAAPDFVLSSGGKSAIANAALARGTGSANLFIGDPRPYPCRWFTAVLSPRRIAGAGNVVEIATTPTSVSPERCGAAAEARFGRTRPRDVWTLLVGGASRSHRFQAHDFTELAEGANALARRFGIRWLVATSRRTGAAADDILARRLDPAAVAELTLFSRDRAAVVAAYLGAAEVVFVTQDSLTMLSEGIASGRPVVALAPAQVALAPASLVSAMLERYDALPGFTRWPIAEMRHRTPPFEEAAPRAGSVVDLDRAVGDVLRRIGRDGG